MSEQHYTIPKIELKKEGRGLWEVRTFYGTYIYFERLHQEDTTGVVMVVYRGSHEHAFRYRNIKSLAEANEVINDHHRQLLLNALNPV